jgi:hypothetical protein
MTSSLGKKIAAWRERGLRAVPQASYQTGTKPTQVCESSKKLSLVAQALLALRHVKRLISE